MRLMQSMYDHNGSNLKAWLYKCPRMQITTLDTHDGLGIVDVADLMTEDEARPAWLCRGFGCACMDRPSAQDASRMLAIWLVVINALLCCL